uniref:EF-hand domain-containing protein n=1 Tax=Arion vulgaris TaxID=1028688 RepID=A0A0B6ZAS3_9EUPU
MMSAVELSQFQKDKLRYYFKFLEPNEVKTIDIHSTDRLMERVYKYTSWTPDSPNAHQCLEVHTLLFEALFEETDKEDGKHKTAVQEDWYTFWSHVLSGCKTMKHFPVWLRLIPKTLFNMIDRNEDAVIEPKELKDFYKEMVRISTSETVLEKWSMKAYAAMTDNGHYPLNLDLFEQIFANFLFGRTPHGPGKYIFGCFKHDISSFQLIQQAPQDDDDDSSDMYANNEKRPRKFNVFFT